MRGAYGRETAAAYGGWSAGVRDRATDDNAMTITDAEGAREPEEIGGRRGGSEVYRAEDIELRAGVGSLMMPLA